MNKNAECKKAEGQTEGQAKKILKSAFVKDNGCLIELIKDHNGPSFLLFNTEGGEFFTQAQVRLDDGTRLMPPEPNLIERNIILLPSEVENYGNEAVLFNEIKTFINRYVELGSF